MEENLYDSLKQICDRRKSHRAFKDIPLTEELINRILYVARTSPYASGKSNWDITVVTDKDVLKKAAEAVKFRASLIEKHIEADFADGFRQYASNFVFFENAPAVFFLNYRVQPSVSLMIKKSYDDGAIVSHSPDDDALTALKRDILGWERDNFVKSISCAAMLVLMAAESLGLGACYMTGPLIAEKEISEIINVKKGRSIGAIIPVGYY